MVAVLAGIGDYRRKRRADLDAVGWVNWPTVQILALIAVAVLVMIGLHG